MTPHYYIASITIGPGVDRDSVFDLISPYDPYDLTVHEMPNKLTELRYISDDLQRVRDTVASLLTRAHDIAMETPLLVMSCHIHKSGVIESTVYSP